jgi:hypothetical protein
MAHECFWHLGYPLRKAGQDCPALPAISRVIALAPLKITYWKT